MKNVFQTLLNSCQENQRPVILDGAMGTYLDDLGVDTNTKRWSASALINHPELVLSAHRDYVLAGADIITTCTFRTTKRAFDNQRHQGYTWQDAAVQAVELARQAAQNSALVAGSIAPLEDCFAYHLAPNHQIAYDEHLTLAQTLVQAKVDILWLETFSSAKEIIAAANAAKQAGKENQTPFAASIVTNQQGQVLSGDNTAALVKKLRDLGAVAICVNCIPPGHVNNALEQFKTDSTTPSGVYANIGRADKNQDWQGNAYLDPQKYCELAAKWVQNGVSLIGACCGSTPKHIRALANRFKPH